MECIIKINIHTCRKREWEKLTIWLEDDNRILSTFLGIIYAKVEYNEIEEYVQAIINIMKIITGNNDDIRYSTTIIKKIKEGLK